MPTSRLKRVLDESMGERRFSDPLYKVHGHRSPRLGFHEPGTITFREEDLKPFNTKVTALPKPDEEEWRAMEEEIEAAQFIPQIENDMESDDFIPYSQTTLDRATDFLRRQMIHAHSASVIGMGVPQIGPADRGSIDLFWEKSDRTLLVNFPSSGEAASYYGKKPKSEISGRFDPSEARADLVIWLAD